MHAAVHVAVLVLFLAGVAGAFIGLISPLLGEGPGFRLVGARRALLLVVGSVALLGADWVFHRLFG